MSDNPITPNSTPWTPQGSESTPWTPSTVSNTNWNSKDQFASYGSLLLSDNRSFVLQSDKVSQLLLP